MSDEQEEKLVVVIGASSDIGGAYMRLADAPHVTFVGQYHRSGDELDALGGQLQARLVSVGCDLHDDAQLDALVSEIDARGVPHSIVFLSAPPAESERFHKKGWAPFASHLDVQLRAPVRLLQALIPKMAKQKRGQVVFVSSSYTLGVPPVGLSDYVCVKYAINGLVKSLAAEYGRKGLRFNAVSPSMVETSYLDAVPRISVEMAAEANPLKRNATVDDVAPMIHFLLSPEAAYINGANVPITAASAM